MTACGVPSPLKPYELKRSRLYGSALMLGTAQSATLGFRPADGAQLSSNATAPREACTTQKGVDRQAQFPRDRVTRNCQHADHATYAGRTQGACVARTLRNTAQKTNLMIRLGRWRARLQYAPSPVLFCGHTGAECAVNKAVDVAAATAAWGGAGRARVEVQGVTAQIPQKCAPIAKGCFTQAPPKGDLRTRLLHQSPSQPATMRPVN